MYDTCRTHVGHVSLVWDHAHWISGKILPQFDPSHLSVAHWEAKLEIFINLEQVQVGRTDTKELTLLPRDLDKF